jgi:single-strand DNA-binding protein
MRDLNQVALIGRLVRDAELKYTQGGTAILTFSLANSADYKDTKYTNFFDCTCFGKLGEAVSQYMVKGKQVAVGGELRQERWEKDGQKRSKVSVRVVSLQLLGGKKDGAQDEGYVEDEEVPF